MNTENQTSPSEGLGPSAFVRLIRKAVDVKASEVRALFLGSIYYFLIFSSYYVIRPIRDNIGAANGTDKLPWLFTGTMIAMLFANALFAALVVKFSRRQFIQIAYRFLIANLLIFFFLLLTLSKEHQVWVGRAFFVWTSVFNLFVVSVFWAFMVDVFSTEQGKRLFGFISVGGTLGAIVGAAITANAGAEDRQPQSASGFRGLTRTWGSVCAAVSHYLRRQRRAGCEEQSRRSAHRRQYLGRYHSQRKVAVSARHLRLHVPLRNHVDAALFSAG